MALEHISTEQQLEGYLDKERFMLFKHSATCPISAEAFKEYQHFNDQHPEVPAIYLIVQEDQELSQFVAEKFHVKHQSPQMIIFKNGNVAWHESHWRITVESISKALEEEQG
ncbi:MULTISPECIES: bacillithiol system redox-active protein YtxJ [Bacillus]|uniref:bacillithiol system redox-active protein YtxJ n=1 Tax=Bacillus TaxID=1386 RepID=UPI00030B6010|nr:MULTISPECIES: bacillithiol system redox-active protein YtxJ [Bacillus]